MFRRCFFIFIWGKDHLNEVLIREIELPIYVAKKEDSFMTTKHEKTNQSISQELNEAYFRDLKCLQELQVILVQ